MPKPKPFARPSISVGGQGPVSAWRYIEAQRVEVGDILSSKGRVLEVIVQASNGATLLMGGDGKPNSYHPEVMVWSFGSQPVCGAFQDPSTPKPDRACGRAPGHGEGHRAASGGEWSA